jgi:hypothetical protein
MKRIRHILIPIVSSLFVVGAVHAVADDKPHTDSVVKAMVVNPGSYVQPKITHEQYGVVKIVVPITTDDKSLQGMKLRNIENGLDSAAKWGGHMHNTVVLYGKGVSLLKDTDPEMRKKIDALKARGVQFDVCDNTLREQGIDFHQLYHVTDRDIVPSGFAEVAYLQSKKGYVVDPVN